MNQLVKHKILHILSRTLLTVNPITIVFVYYELFGFYPNAFGLLVSQLVGISSREYFGSLQLQRKLSCNVFDHLRSLYYHNFKVNFKCPPKPVWIIFISVESRISLALFSILEM